MSEIQVVTLLASCLGMIATVMNLVAFVREKDKSHTRAGLLALSLLIFTLALVFLPRYAPETAHRLASNLPSSVAETVQPWLRQGGASTLVSPGGSELAGSFTIKIQRNLFGGIGALVADFQFSNLTEQAVRVTAYRIEIAQRLGEPTRSYHRVLPEPLTVQAEAAEKTQVELDAEIRDHWVARERLEAPERGPVSVVWECEDASGRQFATSSKNG